MKQRGLLLPIAVVMTANLVALVGVARNRAGRPEAQVELGERELRLAPLGEENTGLVLRLVASRPTFRQSPYGVIENDSSGWLDRSKLAELGFDTRMDPRDAAAQAHYRRVPPKEAFVALEHQANHPQPRLLAVDVARDPETLRRRYPDSQRFIVTRCLVRLWWRKEEIVGGIPVILVSEIYAPLPYGRVLSGLGSTPNTDDFEPRYTVTLCYGKNYEPWICACRLMRGGS